MTTEKQKRAGTARGDDPTRHAPGGSRTETKIAREAALASDQASEDLDTKAPGERVRPSMRRDRRQ